MSKRRVISNENVDAREVHAVANLCGTVLVHREEKTMLASISNPSIPIEPKIVLIFLFALPVLTCGILIPLVLTNTIGRAFTLATMLTSVLTIGAAVALQLTASSIAIRYFVEWDLGYPTNDSMVQMPSSSAIFAVVTATLWMFAGNLYSADQTYVRTERWRRLMAIAICSFGAALNIACSVLNPLMATM